MIAAEVRADWKKVYFGAEPYLVALEQMNDVEERFGADDGTKIVSYFLANASAWRGDVARRVKKELKTMVERPAMVARTEQTIAPKQ